MQIDLVAPCAYSKSCYHVGDALTQLEVHKTVDFERNGD